jgi:glutamate N-acetyltransferase / amino-acid N-acetyltransferase
MNALFSEPAVLSSSQIPRGFAFASATCGLKASGAPDLALISSDVTAVAAAVFTANSVKAAPVLVSKEHLRASAQRVRAVIANSGNANCATGKQGLAAARATAAAAAREIGCAPEQVLVCSTGIIGVPLDVKRIVGSLPRLVKCQSNSPQAHAGVANAIITTDTRAKWAAATCRIGKKEVRVIGCAKGAGMIHPQMATMLGFVLTDAALSPSQAQRALERAAGITFNAISVDGDTSTNDSLILLANGTAGNPEIRSAGIHLRQFVKALESVCRELALMIVADGEGATRVAEIEVRGAPSDALAAHVARTVAGSSLVKTALAGADPNWGRILAAAGRAYWPKRASLDYSKAEIRLGGIVVCRRGQAHPFNEAAAHKKMSAQYVPILLDFKGGSGRAVMWTCDFTAGYVKINASYRT